MRGVLFRYAFVIKKKEKKELFGLFPFITLPRERERERGEKNKKSQQKT